MYKQHGRSFSFLSIILIAFFFIGGLPWRELKADAETHSEYNCSPLSIVYDQTAFWDTTTQAQYTVTNTSAEPVVGWKLELNFSSDVTITNLWNAQDISDGTPPC